MDQYYYIVTNNQKSDRWEIQRSHSHEVIMSKNKKTDAVRFGYMFSVRTGKKLRIESE